MPQRWWDIFLGRRGSNDGGGGSAAAGAALSVPLSGSLGVADPLMPRRIEVIPGALTVHVHSTEVPSDSGPLACRTYLTEGLIRSGGHELVLTVVRPSVREAPAYDAAAVALMRWMFEASTEKGPWTALMGVAMEVPWLGLAEGLPTGLYGVIVVEAASIRDVSMPEGTLALIALTRAEGRVLAEAGPLRVLSRMTHQRRYFPVPFWIDLHRADALTPEQFAGSALSRFERRRFQGISAVNVNGRLVVRVNPERRRALHDLLVERRERPLALLIDPDPFEDGRYVWIPGKKAPEGVCPDGSRTQRLSCCFLAVCAAGSGEDRRTFVEDGAALLLGERTLEPFLHALATGVGLEIPAKGAQQALVLELPRDADERPAEGVPGAYYPYVPQTGQPAGSVIPAGPAIVSLQPPEVQSARVNGELFAVWGGTVVKGVLAVLSAMPENAPGALWMTLSLVPERGLAWRMVTPQGMTEQTRAALTRAVTAVVPPVVLGEVGIEVVVPT